MNPKVEEFIKQQKQKQNESKAEHLKSLGLVEYAETGEKKYCTPSYTDADAKNYGYVHSDEKGRFKYVSGNKAIDVTDAEYEEICKYCPEPKKEDDFQGELLYKVDSIRKMVKFFTIVTVVLLIISIITGIISALSY